jgi:hypothetical protein
VLTFSHKYQWIGYGIKNKNKFDKMILCDILMQSLKKCKLSAIKEKGIKNGSHQMYRVRKNVFRCSKKLP